MKLFVSIIFATLSLAALAQEIPIFSKQEIIYGRKDGMALTMMALTPTSNPNGKAIIHVVSGNWISSFQMLERYLPGNYVYLKRGYTVFMVMHGSQPKYSIIDEVADIKRAVRFIRYHAASYNIDGAHLGITGASSGGNLSLLVAMANDDDQAKLSKDSIDKQSSRVQAVAVFFPPTDMLNYGFNNFDLVKTQIMLEKTRVAGAFDYEKLDEASFTYKPVTDSILKVALVKESSPIYSVTSDDPPALLIHGDADFLVPLQQSKSMIKKLDEQKVVNKLIVKKGGAHGWPNMDPERLEMADWFDTYLK